jgi:hypothetical protein
MKSSLPILAIPRRSLQDSQQRIRRGSFFVPCFASALALEQIHPAAHFKGAYANEKATRQLGGLFFKGE